MENEGIEKATSNFIDEFLAVNPEQTLPTWFKQRTRPQTSDAGEFWKISIVAAKKPERGGFESTTNEPSSKRYVIADSYEELVLFSMSLHKESLNGEVIVNLDLSKIDGDSLVELK